MQTLVVLNMQSIFFNDGDRIKAKMYPGAAPYEFAIFLWRTKPYLNRFTVCPI